MGSSMNGFLKVGGRRGGREEGGKSVQMRKVGHADGSEVCA